MDMNDVSNVISINDYRTPKNHYPMILPEMVREDLIECGYNPDDPVDIDEYWADLLEG